MTTRVQFGCAGLADGVACTERAEVDLRPRERDAAGLPAGAARVRLAMRGWTVTHGGVWCPAHSWQAPPDPVERDDRGHLAPGSPTRYTTRIPGTGRVLHPTGPMPVVLLDDDVVRCARCEDGDHHLCHGQACACTATTTCGGAL